mmetsp:Transcript_87913/g.146813  ORF Transcript_87913/g.146813 Transcript_87913/m.146813 type:complete len:143 (-) Transcript_87913:153-581(-)
MSGLGVDHRGGLGSADCVSHFSAHPSCHFQFTGAKADRPLAPKPPALKVLKPLFPETMPHIAGGTSPGDEVPSTGQGSDGHMQTGEGSEEGGPRAIHSTHRQPHAALVSGTGGGVVPVTRECGVGVLGKDAVVAHLRVWWLV